MQNTRLRDVELSILVENNVMTVSRQYKLIGSGNGNGVGNGDGDGYGDRNGDGNGNGNGNGNEDGELYHPVS